MIEAAEQAARRADLMLVIGTSGVVYPAAGLVQLTPGQVVVLNPASSALDNAADVVLRGTAAELLPRLLAPEVSPAGQLPRPGAAGATAACRHPAM